MGSQDGDLSPISCKYSQHNRIRYSSRDSSNWFSQLKVTDFEWKDYCPDIFSRIRELKKIDDNGYMLTVCSDEVLSKAFSTRKVFHTISLSMDDRFVIKFAQKSDVRKIRYALANYYSYLAKNPNTIIGVVCGLHAVQPIGGVKVYLAVYSKVMPSNNLYRIYDLKGSPEGRKTDKAMYEDKIVLKDENFDFFFYIDPLVREKLMEQLKRDSEFLEAEGLMDYSLMIGIAMGGSFQDQSEGRSCKTVSTFPSPMQSIGRKSSVSDYSSPASTLEDIRPSDSDEVSPRSCDDFRELSFSDMWNAGKSPEMQIPLGIEMQARAVRLKRSQRGRGSVHSSAINTESHDVVLYFSIVDIFQNYGLVKRIERAYKSLKYDRKSINAVNPKIYASRFQEFLSRIFQPEDGNWESL